MQKRSKHNFYKKYGKRALSIICSGGALVVLSPVMLVTSLMVRSKLGTPVIFRQERPGKNEKSFYLYKFRSMTDARNENGNLLPDDDRLPAFGRKLRSTSLDELPELWNIFKGDMAIVGPRPLLVEYLPYYTDEEAVRHTVRPGLTGWAQVNGRNATVWDKLLKQDQYYVENCSLALDARIIFMTVSKVFKKEDILVGAQHGEGHGRLDAVRKYVPQRSHLMNGQPVEGYKETANE